MQTIVATLTGSDQCTALAIVARGTSPVLLLCRLLIEAGCNPDQPLHAYRGDVLCVRVRSIGQAAQLEINGKGLGFRQVDGGER